MKPSRQFDGSLDRVVIGAGISPFTQTGLDEALGLAVGFWCVWLGEDVPEAEPLTSSAEGSGTVARPIVGHDALDLHAEARIVGNGGFEEGDGAFLFLVLHDATEGNTRGVVDADMNELPADTQVAVDDSRLASGDAMTNGANFAELFDIDMDELAGMLALVATNGLGRLECLQAIEPEATKDARHGRFRDAGLARDLRARPALAPQPFDPCDDLGWGRTPQVMRPRGTIFEGGHAFREEPRDPFAHRARAGRRRLH